MIFDHLIAIISLKAAKICMSEVATKVDTFAGRGYARISLGAFDEKGA